MRCGVRPSTQRFAESTGAPLAYTDGTTTEPTADTHPIQREFYDF